MANEVSKGPADLVLFEGWCNGARPEPAELLGSPINQLESDEDTDGAWRRYVNDALELYQNHKPLRFTKAQLKDVLTSQLAFSPLSDG